MIEVEDRLNVFSYRKGLQDDLNKLDIYNGELNEFNIDLFNQQKQELSAQIDNLYKKSLSINPKNKQTNTELNQAIEKGETIKLADQNTIAPELLSYLNDLASSPEGSLTINDVLLLHQQEPYGETITEFLKTINNTFQFSESYEEHIKNNYGVTNTDQFTLAQHFTAIQLWMETSLNTVDIKNYLGTMDELIDNQEEIRSIIKDIGTTILQFDVESKNALDQRGATIQQAVEQTLLDLDQIEDIIINTNLKEHAEQINDMSNSLLLQSQQADQEKKLALQRMEFQKQQEAEAIIQLYKNKLIEQKERLQKAAETQKKQLTQGFQKEINELQAIVDKFTEDNKTLNDNYQKLQLQLEQQKIKYDSQLLKYDILKQTYNEEKQKAQDLIAIKEEEKGAIQKKYEEQIEIQLLEKAEFSKQVQELKYQIQIKDQNIQQQEQLILDRKRQLENQEQQMIRLEQQHENEVQNLTVASQREKQVVLDRLDEIKQQRNQLKGQLAEQQLEINKLTLELESQISKNKELQNMVDQQAADIAEQKETIQDWQSKYNRLEESSQQKLQNINEQLKEIDNQAKVMEINHAERVQQLNNQINSKDQEIDELLATINGLEADLAEVQQQNAKLIIERDILLSEKANIEIKLQISQKENQNLQQQITDRNEELINKQNQLDNATDEINILKGTIKQLQQENSQLTYQTEQQAELIQSNTNIQLQLEARIKDLEVERDNIQKEIETQMQYNENRRIDIMQKQIDSQSQTMLELNAQLQIKDVEIDDLKMELKKMQVANAQYINQQSANQGQLMENSQQIEQLQEQLNTYMEQLPQLQLETRQLQNQVQLYQQEIFRLTEQINVQNNQIMDYDSKLQQLQETENAVRNLNAQLQQQEQYNLQLVNQIQAQNLQFQSQVQIRQQLEEQQQSFMEVIGGLSNLQNTDFSNNQVKLQNIRYFVSQFNRIVPQIAQILEAASTTNANYKQSAEAWKNLNRVMDQFSQDQSKLLELESTIKQQNYQNQYYENQIGELNNRIQSYMVQVAQASEQKLLIDQLRNQLNLQQQQKQALETQLLDRQNTLNDVQQQLTTYKLQLEQANGRIKQIQLENNRIEQREKITQQELQNQLLAASNAVQELQLVRNQITELEIKQRQDQIQLDAARQMSQNENLQIKTYQDMVQRQNQELIEARQAQQNIVRQNEMQMLQLQNELVQAQTQLVDRTGQLNALQQQIQNQHENYINQIKASGSDIGKIKSYSQDYNRILNEIRLAANQEIISVSENAQLVNLYSNNKIEMGLLAYINNVIRTQKPISQTVAKILNNLKNFYGAKTLEQLQQGNQQFKLNAANIAQTVQNAEIDEEDEMDEEDDDEDVIEQEAVQPAIQPVQQQNQNLQRLQMVTQNIQFSRQAPENQIVDFQDMGIQVGSDITVIDGTTQTQLISEQVGINEDFRQVVRENQSFNSQVRIDPLTKEVEVQSDFESTDFVNNRVQEIIKAQDNIQKVSQVQRNLSIKTLDNVQIQPISQTKVVSINQPRRALTISNLNQINIKPVQTTIQEVLPQQQSTIQNSTLALEPDTLAQQISKTLESVETQTEPNLISAQDAVLFEPKTQTIPQTLEEPATRTIERPQTMVQEETKMEEEAIPLTDTRTAQAIKSLTDQLNKTKNELAQANKTISDLAQKLAQQNLSRNRTATQPQTQQQTSTANQNLAQTRSQTRAQTGRQQARPQQQEDDDGGGRREPPPIRNIPPMMPQDNRQPQQPQQPLQQPQIQGLDPQIFQGLQEPQGQQNRQIQAIAGAARFITSADDICCIIEEMACNPEFKKYCQVKQLQKLCKLLKYFNNKAKVLNKNVNLFLIKLIKIYKHLAISINLKNEFSKIQQGVRSR